MKSPVVIVVAVLCLVSTVVSAATFYVSTNSATNGPGDGVVERIAVESTWKWLMG